MDYKYYLNTLPKTSKTAFGIPYPSRAGLHIFILFTISVIIDIWQYYHAARFEDGKLVINMNDINQWMSFPSILLASFLAETAYIRWKILHIVTKIEKEYAETNAPLSDEEKVDGFYYVYRKATNYSFLSLITGFLIFMSLIVLHTIVSLFITYIILL